MNQLEFQLSDDVIRRIVQIVQEGFLTGTDVSDHFRMIRLTTHLDHSSVLELTDEYVDMVRKQHEKMLKFAEEQKLASQIVSPEQPTILLKP